MALFGEPHVFSDVDASGAADNAATYLAVMADTLRASRDEALALLGLGPGSVFLDAGCGLGEVVIEVASQVAPGGSAIGVDLSAELIERARRSAAEQGAAARFEVGDVGKLAFAETTFDAVRCERVLQHLDDDAAAAAVAEFVRVTKPGGRIQLVDPVHAQHVVDCDDTGLFQAVVQLLVDRIRDPYSGIRLARRLRAANTTVVSFDSHARQWPNLNVWRQALGLDQHLAALASTGDISDARAQAFLVDLAARDAAGNFSAVTVEYRATAVKDR